MTTAELTEDQRAKERSIWFGIIMDVPFLMVKVSVSLAGGSFTLMAESIRGWLAVALECFTFSVLRRIHRGVLADLDYGTGKLEQVANTLIGGGGRFGDHDITGHRALDQAVRVDGGQRRDDGGRVVDRRSGRGLGRRAGVAVRRRIHDAERDPGAARRCP